MTTAKEIRRYNCCSIGGMELIKDGYWVEYDDYVIALQEQAKEILEYIFNGIEKDLKFNRNNALQIDSINLRILKKHCFEKYGVKEEKK